MIEKSIYLSSAAGDTKFALGGPQVSTYADDSIGIVVHYYDADSSLKTITLQLSPGDTLQFAARLVNQVSQKVD